VVGCVKGLFGIILCWVVGKGVDRGDKACRIGGRCGVLIKLFYGIFSTSLVPYGL